MKKVYVSAIAALVTAAGASAQMQEAGESQSKVEIEQKISSWRLVSPLGIREQADVDTNFLNYAQRSVPSARSLAFATTGNLGAPGYNLVYFDRKPAGEFMFADALQWWLPSFGSQRFYNTRIPMTIASYNFGGGKESQQDRLKADFSGNINARAQIGAMVDYLYSKGSYNYQAVKDLSWGFSGSYIGDKYEFIGFLQHYNAVNKENGGITDDRYITDPAEIQGGSTSVDYKTIPTRLSNAHNRVVGTRLYLNNKYKLGFYRDVEDGDSVREQFVPVTSFIWTLDYGDSRHTFRNQNAAEAREFWENTYLNPQETNDKSSYWSLRNTFGVSLLEGFNKYAKAGLTAFITHEYRHFTQPTDTIDRSQALPDGYTPLPFAGVPAKQGENYVWVGGELSKRMGRILNYNASVEFGVIGEAAGEVKASGTVATHIPLRSDTLSVTAYGLFSNTNVPYFLKHYVSNHFAWDNDFSKTRRFRVGGAISYPRTATTLSAGVENVQNLVYFNDKAMPEQHGKSVQVFSASLQQNFEVGILNWQNRITYQTSSEQSVIPLPKLALYSNLFIKFKVARVLDVQFGVDCDYYTKYKSVAYQPATMAFYNQNEVDCGNYPFVNAYMNFKLSKTRFYIMFSHVNQGLFGGNSWFSMPGYPLNPRRFQLGLSIDFAN